MNHVVLLDRDGTVVAEPIDQRIDTFEKIELFSDSIEALRLLTDNGIAVIFITNQAGIAEGRITEKQFWELHNEVLRRLSPSGVKVLKTYVNGEAGPHASLWRKPGPNMLLQAADDFQIDLASTYMIGDRPTDIQASVAAGCKGGVLVKTSDPDAESTEAIYTANTLLDAVRYIIQH